MIRIFLIDFLIITELIDQLISLRADKEVELLTEYLFGKEMYPLSEQPAGIVDFIALEQNLDFLVHVDFAGILDGAEKDARLVHFDPLAAVFPADPSCLQFGPKPIEFFLKWPGFYLRRLCFKPPHLVFDRGGQHSRPAEGNALLVVWDLHQLIWLLSHIYILLSFF